MSGSGTNILYRGFTNKRSDKNLSIPAQTSINFAQTPDDAAYLLKFFNYFYNVNGITYTTSYNYYPGGNLFTLNALNEINFSPSLPVGTNSFDDSVYGTKPLPVYQYTNLSDLLIG